MPAAPNAPGLVVTRPRKAAEALAAQLSPRGVRVFVFPALEIEPLAGGPALERALDALQDAALAVFVSANAVEQGLARVGSRGAWPPRVAVAAIGDATARALRNSGFADVISPPEPFDTDSLARLPELQEGRVRGENVVVFRGEGGRERLKGLLEERGARVTYAECYRRVRPRADPGPLIAAWERGEVQAVSALSAETLANFLALLGPAAPRLAAAAALIVPHEAVAAHPGARRFARTLVAAPGAEGIEQALSQMRVTP